MKVRMFDAKKSDVFDFRFSSLPPSFKKIRKKSCISYTNALDFLCFLTVSDVGQGVGYIKKV